MPLDSLNNRQYIKDDVMFIKIIVDWTRWCGCWGHLFGTYCMEEG
jgi:hypothetical protein